MAVSERWVYFAPDDQEQRSAAAGPPGSVSFLQATSWLLPPMVSHMHQSFHAWSKAGISPGPVLPERIRLSPEGIVAFRFRKGELPHPTSEAEQAANLAAWLVLLDKYVETFVVVARARAEWTVNELSHALTFVTPSLLPSEFLALPPNNWERVAKALALAIADGPLHGAPNNRHWSKSQAFGNRP